MLHLVKELRADWGRAAQRASSAGDSGRLVLREAARRRPQVGCSLDDETTIVVALAQLAWAPERLTPHPVRCWRARQS